MNALIPLLPHRPAVLPHAGGTIFLSVHDAAYLREQASWKRQLMEAHPDRRDGRSRRGGRVRKVIAGYRAWQAEERAWYATVGLMPPDRGVAVEAPVVRVETVPRKKLRVGQEERTCPPCGAVFVAPRHSPKQQCSRSCGQRARRQRALGLTPPRA